MASDAQHASKIPKINFAGLHPSVLSSEQWEAAKTEAGAALFSHGCFEAIYPSLSPEIREAMFDFSVPEVFALPLEAKLRLTSDEPFRGYVGQIPNMAYESLPIEDVLFPGSVEKFAKLMWPDGNSNFCKTVLNFAKVLHELMMMVLRMILQSLGVEKYYVSVDSSSIYAIRMAEYGVPFDQETKIALKSHVDPNLITIVVQHKIDGLEVQTSDGSWVNVDPCPNSVTVMAGYAFQAWSNMRLRAPSHRVRMFGNEERFSVLFSSRPIRNSTVKGPEELGDDDEHPLLVKPYNYSEFVKFLYSEEGRRSKDAFNAFCMLDNEATSA